MALLERVPEAKHVLKDCAGATIPARNSTMLVHTLCKGIARHAAARGDALVPA